ncbi:hypothetical protein PUR49_06775 [Streptomyces sp. BE147]|uniref:hypothetical protein n=1 Tax=Streptomyces sp. BE147 TaxID=3002524 RepID=UPI002E7A9CD0|nr:hypothetical protein [Streptomyces sp. BE147]MEE1736210.1 hypothetical protein [Streptomyces sp. BE147]
MTASGKKRRRQGPRATADPSSGWNCPGHPAPRLATEEIRPASDKAPTRHDHIASGVLSIHSTVMAAYGASA